MKLMLKWGGVAMLCIPAIASASPLAPRTVNELLGVKPGTADVSFSSSAPAVYTANSPLRQAPLKADDAGAYFFGSVIYPTNARGMSSYSLAEWNPKRVSLDLNIFATGGGFATAGGKYYFTSYQSAMGFEAIKTYSYNMADWTMEDEYTGSINYVATTVAYSEARDEVYGCFINEERTGYNFVKWDYSYFRPKLVISEIERPWSGCAFSEDGTLYAIERNGDLYTVDLMTGDMTLVGSTGVTSDYQGDAAINPADGMMYWSVCTDTEYALYKVDVKSATATKVYDLDNQEQICGMFFPLSSLDVADGAPAKASSVSASSFSAGKFTGKVNFYSPRNTKGGAALPTDENLTYTIRANGKVIATGSTLPNKRVTADVTLDKSDNYWFTVTTSNAAGESEVVGFHKFVGIDRPRLLGNLTARLTADGIQLSWSNVSSTGVNGGDVDYSNATFKVVRHPDNKVLVDNEYVRSVNDEMPTPEVRTDYYYTVTGKVGELETNTLTSSVIALGPIVPPYEGLFNSTTSVAGWTLIDVADDGYKWGYYSSDKALQIDGSRGYDDWAISPAVKVKENISYGITLNVSTSNYRDEIFEVKWGTEPTVEAMTNVLMDSVKLRTTTPTDYNADLASTVTGKIYIGIHAITPSPSYRLNIHGIKIADGQSADAPAAVTSFTATSPVDGTREVTVKFVAPALTLGGSPLEGDKACEKIEISRDGKVIATITEGISAGSNVEYTDKADDLKLGTHVYSAMAYNAFGSGPAVEAEVLVGARKPVAPAEAKMIENGNTGSVTISWTPVDTDVEGNKFSSDAVSYRVINRDYETVADNVTETSITLQAVEEGTQAFCQFGVYAITAGGESDKMTGTAYKPVGKPYETPWNESFANAQVSSIFGYNFIKGNEPWQFKGEHEWGITSQDNDGGFAYQECYGDLTALVTGKIDLDGLNNPTFSYYTYNYSSGSTYPNSLIVEVDNGDGRGFVKVQENIVAETGPANAWNKVLVPLTDYEGQSVIFRIVPANPGLAVYTLDNLRVASYVDYNLSATAFSAPGVVENGKPFELQTLVTNTGENPISGYSVELWRNDEFADFKECGRIEPNATATIIFEQTLTPIDGEDVVYKTVIVCDNDLVEGDNTSKEVTVGNMSPAVPTVNDLAVSASDDAATLTWTAPDVKNAAPAAATETFDAAESWSNSVSGWKFVDEDKVPFGGIQTPDYPCTGLQSWYVADTDFAGIVNGTAPERWNAHSGKKFIVSGYVQRGDEPAQSDDWAITPMLWSTYPQIFSFYAKSFDPKYLETLEVLASSSTTAVSDFVSLGTVYDIANSWTNIRFKLPAGTKYAAVRSRSINKFLLFIDDVTFIPADGVPESLTITGYNIYRDGIKLNNEPVATPGYTDSTVKKGSDYSYVVTTVYEQKGESAVSNKVGCSVSGIDGVYGDGKVNINVAGHNVVVTGLADGYVSIVAADGRVVATADAAPVVRISLRPGVYVVKAGNVTAKALVM